MLIHGISLFSFIYRLEYYYNRYFKKQLVFATVPFLCLRVANPHEFSFGLKISAHLGIFITIAGIGLAISGIGYFVAKKLFENLKDSVRREEDNDTINWSHVDSEKKSPIRISSISPRKAAKRNIKSNISTQSNAGNNENNQSTILGIVIKPL